MSAARALSKFFMPRPWAGCTPPAAAERLAEWERRRGEHRAQQRLREARVAQAFDELAGVRPAISPRLP